MAQERYTPTPQERQQIFERDKDESGKTKCYVCEEYIIDGEAWDVDHIVALADGGPNKDLSNFAAAHHGCNLRKGVKSILVARNEYRVLKKFDEDFAKLLPLYKHPEIVVDEKQMLVRFNGQDLPLYRCPTTRTLYFYHLIPIKHIRKDAAGSHDLSTKTRFWDLVDIFNSTFNFHLPCAGLRMENFSYLMDNTRQRLKYSGTGLRQ